MPKVNSHVERMNRHLPFTPSHEQIYEEYQKDTDVLNIETNALKYLISAVLDGAKFIVLTGDAGHGKTHLCRRLIEKYLKIDSSEARKILLEKCDGVQLIKNPDNTTSLPLRIHKDFSELEISQAAKYFDSVSAEADYVTIICANEGRLRAVISQSPNNHIANQISDVFHDSFNTGMCTKDGKLHILNLNFQSVAGFEVGEKSILGTIINIWVEKGDRWKVSSCGSCALNKRCPIYHNRQLISENSEIGERRRKKIEEIFATIERLGGVITIREALMTVSYIVTGGLTCLDVKNNSAKNKQDGWQSEYAFYNLMFKVPRTVSRDSALKRIPVLSYLIKLDPGKRANRSVDERLLNQANVFPANQIDLMFRVIIDNKIKIVDGSSGIDDINVNPTNKKEKTTESEQIELVVTSLRRRSYFDESLENGSSLIRLGFKYGNEFIEILNGSLTGQKNLQYKAQVLAGLHMIQGLQMSSKTSSLYLVDPAFGKATTGAAIIARTIPSNGLQLLPMRAGWRPDKNSFGKLTESVNWIDRHIILRFDIGNQTEDLILDLMSFECLNRAAFGYIAERFYAHDLRRIRNFLGRLAEKNNSENEQISLFMDGHIKTITLDEKIIQVSQ